MKHLCSILLVVFLFVCCTPSQQDPKPIDEHTMASVLTDLYLLEGYVAIQGNYDYDQYADTIDAVCDTLFAKYGITHEDFRQSLDYYMAHADRYDTIYTYVLASIDSMEAKGQPHTNH